MAALWIGDAWPRNLFRNSTVESRALCRRQPIVFLHPADSVHQHLSGPLEAIATTAMQPARPRAGGNFFPGRFGRARGLLVRFSLGAENGDGRISGGDDDFVFI